MGSDKVRGEEAVQSTIILEHAGQNSEPAPGMWRHARDKCRRWLDPIAGALGKEGFDPLFASCGSRLQTA